MAKKKKVAAAGKTVAKTPNKSAKKTKVASKPTLKIKVKPAVKTTSKPSGKQIAKTATVAKSKSMAPNKQATSKAKLPKTKMPAKTPKSKVPTAAKLASEPKLANPKAIKSKAAAKSLASNKINSKDTDKVKVDKTKTNAATKTDLKPTKNSGVKVQVKDSKVSDEKAPKNANKSDETIAEVEDEYEEEILLTDAEGNIICRVPDCDQVSQVDSYCRYHYLLFWKKIQARKKILSEGKLERYIEELTARYPDKFLDVLKKDLRNQKDFLAAIQELEIDDNHESGDFDDEDSQNYLDEIRGVGDAVSTSREDEDF